MILLTSSLLLEGPGFFLLCAGILRTEERQTVLPSSPRKACFDWQQPRGAEWEKMWGNLPELLSKVVVPMKDCQSRLHNMPSKAMRFPRRVFCSFCCVMNVFSAGFSAQFAHSRPPVWLCSRRKRQQGQWPDQHANTSGFDFPKRPFILSSYTQIPRSHTYTHSGAVWARHRGLGDLSEMAPLKWQPGPEKPKTEKKGLHVCREQKKYAHRKFGLQNLNGRIQKLSRVLLRKKDLQMQQSHLTKHNYTQHKLHQSATLLLLTNRVKQVKPMHVMAAYVAAHHMDYYKE